MSFVRKKKCCQTCCVGCFDDALVRRLALLRRAVAPLVSGDLRLDAGNVHAAAVPGGLAARRALGLAAHVLFGGRVSCFRLVIRRTRHGNFQRDNYQHHP